jgi:hypothetical protein
MLAWNKGKLGTISSDQIVIRNSLRAFTLAGLDAAVIDLDKMCLNPAGALLSLPPGTRGFVAFVSLTVACASSAYDDIALENSKGNTTLVNTETSSPGHRWDIVVTDNAEAVELLAQPAGAYAILGNDHTVHEQTTEIPSPAPTKNKDSNTAMILVGAAVGGLLGLVAAGPVGGALGGAAGAFAGSLAS